jgi:hypothetical protein
MLNMPEVHPVKRILITAIALLTLTGCTRSQINAWLNWEATDPDAAHAWLTTPEGQALTTPRPAPTATSASSDGRCVGYENLLAAHSPGWDITRMSRIMYRESRCQPDAANACCHGLLQMHEMHVGWINAVDTASDYYDPTANIRAAAELWTASGYGAWSTS